jgi:hypothetical protein
MRTAIDKILADAVRTARKNEKRSTIFFKQGVDMQKIAGEKRTMKTKSLPVFMNRNQLAAETNFPLRKLYRANIPPDARDVKGAPLFAIGRLPEISRILNTRDNREILA